MRGRAPEMIRRPPLPSRARGGSPNEGAATGPYHGRMFRLRPAATGAQPADGDVVLADGDVALLYRLLLGRTPSADEIAAQRRATDDWRVLLAAIVASDEHRMHRATAFGPNDTVRRVNVWHPELASWGHQAGTYSSDGEAVMGRDGFVFLVRGTNSVLDQFQLDFELPAGWAAKWSAALQARQEDANELGVTLGALVVPDKLSVLHDSLPPGVDLPGRPPASVLAERHRVRYPVAELAGVSGGAFLRTDTHLSFAGNAALAAVALEELAATDSSDGLDEVTATDYLSSGDLGSRFAPQIVEVMRSYNSWGHARLTVDNWPDMEAQGKHVGTRRVLRNDGSPDPRIVVVFGDSYAFPQPHYHGIAWYFAQKFRETHFVWSPFGWDAEYVKTTGASLVLCETAERFVPRPPAQRMDVQSLFRGVVNGQVQRH